MSDNPSSGVLLSWKVWLAKKNPARAVSVAVLILICAYFVFFTTGDLLLTVIGAAVLMIMVLPYYLPTTFILTEEEVIKKMLFSTRARRWEEFRRFRADKRSVKLFTMEKPSRLDNYRAFLLICNKNIDEVLRIVKDRIEAAAKASEP
ncbi:MAG: hypothetical protein U5N26_06240 [Candidatus Marinimicrobia bacterium]|nr:hypothetical protein [Candidatus Neomarinimicrobiota bacterium]